jgi:L-asparaginase
MPAKVLVIYTGGTIGSRPRDPDPDSPQVVVPWRELYAATPEIDRLGFEVDCISTPEPLDSCNVSPAEWVFMVETIEQNYHDYSGFVILHGTDTMVYTASALSFMLRNLGKPVVLTGSQRSAMVDVRNDATQNFLTSLLIANPDAARIPVIPEVVIFFGGKILRGNRTVKRDTSGYAAYETPNLAPLGTVGDQIVIDTNLIQPPPEGRFVARKRLDTAVLPVLIFPGIQNTYEVVDRLLVEADPKAAVVMSFGSGNIPTRSEFLDVFRQARARGVVLANVSQCQQGPVELGIYETSAELLEAGFVAANDITFEAAQCKLMVLLASPDVRDMEPHERQALVEREFEVSLAGEQSVSVIRTDYDDGGGRVEVTDGPGRARVRGANPKGRWTPGTLQRALIRLRGAKVVSTNEDAVEFRVFLNLDPDAEPDDGDPGFAGTFRKWPSDKEGIVVFDVTRTFRVVATGSERISPTIVVDTPGATLTWERTELALFVNELGT